MRSGQLNKSISIYSTNETANDLGEIVIAPTTLVKTVRAGVTYKMSGESESNGQLTPHVNILFTIRYFKAITEDMYIQYEGALYNIVSIVHYDTDKTVLYGIKSKLPPNV